ncbi:MAG: manganese efflux pump, partial [Ruminococcus sp.]|nr:manganese efflux pump [Ruminococcus sp.]
MEIWELFLVAVSLSMDAFAVSVCKGLSVKKLRPRHCATAGLYFGGFQALMPLLGWLLGRQFESLIKSIDHWIAFVLLALIGANMIREALGDEEDVNDSFSFKTMLPLAVAT